MGQRHGLVGIAPQAARCRKRRERRAAALLRRSGGVRPQNGAELWRTCVQDHLVSFACSEERCPRLSVAWRCAWRRSGSVEELSVSTLRSPMPAGVWRSLASPCFSTAEHGFVLQRARVCSRGRSSLLPGGRSEQRVPAPASNGHRGDSQAARSHQPADASRRRRLVCSVEVATRRGQGECGACRTGCSPLRLPQVRSVHQERRVWSNQTGSDRGLGLTRRCSCQTLTSSSRRAT